jgi:hypothetical protein
MAICAAFKRQPIGEGNDRPWVKGIACLRPGSLSTTKALNGVELEDLNRQRPNRDRRMAIVAPNDRRGEGGDQHHQSRADERSATWTYRHLPSFL